MSISTDPTVYTELPRASSTGRLFTKIFSKQQERASENSQNSSKKSLDGATPAAFQAEDVKDSIRGIFSGKKRFWIDDKYVSNCYMCKTPFSTFRRRHHCRICGQIFCGRCSQHTIKREETLRVCNYCYKLLNEEEGGDIEDTQLEIQSTDDVNDKQPSRQNSAITLKKREPNMEIHLKTHLKKFISGFLRRESLSEEWLRILESFSMSSAALKPMQSDMDIRHRISIKRVTGGNMDDSILANGVIFTGYLARNGMRTRIENPKIIALSFPLISEREEFAFTQLQLLVSQEIPHLKLLAKKIIQLSPDILISTRKISCFLVDILAQEGISVLSKLKKNVFDDIVEQTGATVLSSLSFLDESAEGISGTCGEFRVENFKICECQETCRCNREKKYKSVCVFENGSPTLQISFLLRGEENLDRLGKLKEILRFSCYVANSIKLEVEFFENISWLYPEEGYSSSESENDEVSIPISTSPFVELKVEELNDFRDNFEGKERNTDIDEEYTSEKAPNVGNDVKMGFTCLNKQFIVLLYSTQSMETKSFCIQPEIKMIQFFSKTDTTVGAYLISLFEGDSVCSNSKCKSVPSGHLHLYTYGNSRVVMAVETAGEWISGNNWDDSNTPILGKKVVHVWINCPSSLELPVPEPVSYRTGSFSFGKLMENLFQNSKIVCGVCGKIYGEGHSLSFSHNRKVLTIRQERIVNDSVVMPLHKLVFSAEIAEEFYLLELNEFIATFQAVYRTILLKLRRIKAASRNLLDETEFGGLFQRFKAEKDEIKQFVEVLRKNKGGEKVFQSTKLKRKLFENITFWSSTVHNLVAELVRARRNIMITGKKQQPQPNSNGKGSQNTSRAKGMSLQLTHSHFSSPSPRGGEVALGIHGLPQTPNGADLTHFVTLNVVSKRAIGGLAVPFMNSDMKTNRVLMGIPHMSEKGSRRIIEKFQYEGPEMTKPDMTPTHGIQTPLSEWSLPFLDEEVRAKSNGERAGSDPVKRNLMRNMTFAGAVHNFISKELDFDGGVNITDGFIFLKDGMAGQAHTIYPNEPTSIVSYSMCSSEYGKQLSKYITAITQDCKGDQSSHDLFRTILTSERDTTLNISFTTKEPDDKMKFECLCYFEVHFFALRHALKEKEDRFVLSLSRCNKWEAMGGKSKAKFYRTLDGRYIMKAVSQTELDSFLSIANTYFKHMDSVIYGDMSSMLVEVVGCYRVTIGGQKHDFIVMPNLFFDRKIDKMFDLKGSERNRYVKIKRSSKEDTVLWDVNLLEYIEYNPILVDEQSRALLSMCVWNDTLLLSRLNILDYSMLVGFDSEKRVIYVGIIDYLRQYTWDKQVESWVKSTGVMGGKGKIPTVIEPKEYKIRFRNAMERYFLFVPNQFSTMVKYND